MKQFRKNSEGHFICEECERICKDKTALMNHNRNTHKISRDEYFNKWIKEEGDDICIICGNKTKLVRTDVGYKTTCTIKCQNIYAAKQTKNANLKKYGVENPFQRSDIIKKCKETKLERYGENWGSDIIEKGRHVRKEKYKNGWFDDEKMKQNNFKKYRVEHNWQREDVKEKIKETCLRLHNNENYRNSEKIKKTNIRKYGVDNPWKNKEIKKNKENQY
jgi:hypothetical protein